MAENILTLPSDANPLLKRAMLFLESGDFTSATEYCGKVLDTEPENPFAYIIHLMAARNVQNEKQLVFISEIREDQDFKFARRFADPELAAKLDELARKSAEQNASTERLQKLNRLGSLVSQMEKQLRRKGVTLSEMQTRQLSERIAAAKALMAEPAPESGELNSQIAACEATLTGSKKADSRFLIMLIIGVGLIVVAAIISFLFWTFVEPHLAK